MKKIYLKLVSFVVTILSFFVPSIVSAQAGAEIPIFNFVSNFLNWDFASILGDIGKDMVQFFLGMLFWPFLLFFRLIITVLPPVSKYPLPEGVTDAITLFLGYAYQFDLILPVNTILSVVGYAFIFFSLVLTWRLARFIINVVRGSGG